GTVVGDADHAETAPGGDDVDARSAGVDRVLDQLLDHARGPLDDLTGRDAVDEIRRELAYRHDVPRRRRDTGGSALYPILPPAGRTGRRRAGGRRGSFPA